MGQGRIDESTRAPRLPLPRKRSLKFFATAAALGLVLSIVSHGFALLGLGPPLGEVTGVLHLGALVVAFPSVIVARPFMLGGEYFGIKDRWRRGLLRGCPPWMRNMMAAFAIYAMINFVVFMVSYPSGRAVTPEVQLRMFSGHLMALYSFSLAILWSAVVVNERDVQRRCTAGHLVFSAAAKYCEICGRPVLGAAVLDPSGAKFADPLT